MYSKGKQVTSKQSVVVALAEVESSTGTVRSGAEMPFNLPEIVEANRSVLDQAVVSSQADQPSQPPLQKTKPQDKFTAGARDCRAPKMTTTVVSPGDSLWRISRVTYGAGMQYAVVYKENRDHIRNPNRIYPGQIFVLPMKAR
jgi:nucleoid-associated protein YgaU